MKVGSLIRTGGPGILLPKVALMNTPPIGPMLDPAVRVLAFPLELFTHCYMPRGSIAGLPAGVIEIDTANLLLAATPCNAPMFVQALEAACAKLRRDVMLVRTGLFPETIDPVTVDVALTVTAKPLVVKRLTFARHRDKSIWLVPEGAAPFLQLRPEGLAISTVTPFRTSDERSDAVCRAAAEIVRIGTRSGRN
ncbi:hypothetical protein [Sphingomonas sp. IW22]|uniref:hypothetical protein n=1 Tax=Sphingomonas sp. IW22 TaxID=3242489 RepID=UPI003520DA27